MKKYMMMFLAAVSFGLTSCEEHDLDPGGTAVKDMCGKWDVHIDVVDENGNVLEEDPYSLGTFTLLTYNTAANTDKEMWVEDQGNFWDFKMKVDVDYPNRSFSCPQKDYNEEDALDGTAVITGGKVMKDAAKNRHGAPIDSIAFNIVFSDDDEGFIYRFSGKRYTGFVD